MVGALEDAFKRNLPPNGLLEVKGGEAVSDIQSIKANSEGGRQGHAGKLDHYRLKLRNSRPRRQIFREADQIGAEPPPRLCEIDRTHPQRMPVEVVPVVERAASGGVEQHAEGRRLHRARPRVVRQVGEEPGRGGCYAANRHGFRPRQRTAPLPECTPARSAPDATSSAS